MYPKHKISEIVMVGETNDEHHLALELCYDSKILQKKGIEVKDVTMSMDIIRNDRQGEPSIEKIAGETCKTKTTQTFKFHIVVGPTFGRVNHTYLEWHGYIIKVRLA